MERNPPSDWLNDTTPINRAGFLKRGLVALGQNLLSQVEQIAAPFTHRAFIRPPGAQAEAVFLALCTRCDACTAACPHEAISVLYGHGEPVDGTPVMRDLRHHPCLLCPDTPCIPACPTDALLPVKQTGNIKVGTAVINRLTCSAFGGSGCTTCYDVCPVKDEAIELKEGLPFVVDAACTGCGICQHHCPEEPEAITVYP